MTKYFSYTFDSSVYAGFTTSGHVEGDFENELDVETWLMNQFGEKYEDYVRGWEEEDEDYASDYTLEVVELSKERYDAEYDYFNFDINGRKGYFQI